jgi:hypothetical protein
MQLSACRKSETIREAANWHSRRRRKERRDWRRRWECSFRLAGNQKPSAKRLTGTATGDERSNATGGGGGNAAFGLPEIGKHREAGNWHSHRRRKEQRDWRRRWECSFRLAGNQKPSAKRPTGTAAGDERSDATGGGGGNAASGLPEIGKHREAAHWHSHRRRKEQRDWRRRWECSFRLAGNRKTPRSSGVNGQVKSLAERSFY